jgi:hypothetical protein
MKPPDLVANCQLPGLGRIAEGQATLPPQSPARRLKLFIRRRLSPRHERQFKRRSNDLLNGLGRLSGRPERPQVLPTGDPPLQLHAGDWVRVRSRAEIDATLDHWRQLRGCTFMPEMAPYCGTTQRVLKPLERFVDERDLRVKMCRAVVLLDGVICQGTADFGRCDRACALFWRVEWLEKLDPSSVSGSTGG